MADVDASGLVDVSDMMLLLADFGKPVGDCAAHGPANTAQGDVVATVTQTSTDGPGTTYQLSITLSGSAKNVYTIYGDDASAMSLPPAYQSDAPFGANIGGIPAAFIAAVPTTAYDSWLSVGITNGDGGGALSSIGIDWDIWTTDSGLNIDNGAVFWMSPDDGPSRSVVIAQITAAGDFSATISAQGRSTSGGDWQAPGITFSSGGGSGGCGGASPPPPPPSSPVFAVASYITAEMDAWLQAQPAIGSEGWTVCFNSATDDTASPSIFHSRCDQFSESVSSAHNSLGYTFGGYVRELLSFPISVHCFQQNSRASISFWHFFGEPFGSHAVAHPCLALRSCVLQADASGGVVGGGTAACFIFKLGGDGAGSERFDPSDARLGGYQYAGSSRFPTWGDLYMGSGALGASAQCSQYTYTAATNQVCGGDNNWGATDLVVLARTAEQPTPCCSTRCRPCGSGTACDGCDGSCNSSGPDYCDQTHPEWADDCDRAC
jgi:hypothetical protein